MSCRHGAWNARAIRSLDQAEPRVAFELAASADVQVNAMNNPVFRPGHSSPTWQDRWAVRAHPPRLPMKKAARA